MKSINENEWVYLFRIFNISTYIDTLFACLKIKLYILIFLRSLLSFFLRNIFSTFLVDDDVYLRLNNSGFKIMRYPPDITRY